MLSPTRTAIKHDNNATVFVSVEESCPKMLIWTASKGLEAPNSCNWQVCVISK